MGDDVGKLIQEMKDRMDKLEAENQALKEKTERIPDADSNLFEMEKRNKYAETHPEPTVIKKEAGFTGKENACPFCNHNKHESLLDLTNSGRWSCRKCGKNWFEEDLNLPWSLKMERSQFVRKYAETT